MQDSRYRWSNGCIIDRLPLSINLKIVVFTGELNVDVYETKGDSQGRHSEGEEREAEKARSVSFLMKVPISRFSMMV